MNNKGFAITGIIYTLFIIFLMIVLSLLAGLNSYLKLMSSSTEYLETSFDGKQLVTLNDEEVFDSNSVTKYVGKYVFMNGCTTYLSAGIDLYNDTINFIQNDCADYKITSIRELNRDKTYIFKMES